ncbi:MAG: SusD/RagB family nutrient-binding outer membrane lipoprotein [Paludibacteraceae bacterium]|nr:SusD/RagB family nutrient-binding outer membrane lipoprotein [Paludibacteraceae bacterium]
MKKHLISLSARVLVCMSVAVFVLASCSDKIYEEINTDPTKADHVNPSSQLSYAELQIYGDMNYVDVHRLYTYAFTQHLMGCWNTTNYGGQHRMDDNEMSRPWNNLYAGAIRNLTDAIEATKDDATQVNIHAALRIFRVYVGSLLTDYYGDVPFSEAGMGYITGNSKPKYDKQEDLYRFFFTELKEAAALFDISAKAITSDPLFGGNIAEWITFANSLRLRYAMRLSDVLPDFAKTEFVDALEDGVMVSGTDDACVKHLNVSYSFGQEAFRDIRGNAMAKYFYGNDPANNPSYLCQTFWEQLYKNNDPRTTRLCRFFIDDYMSISTGDGRIDVTDAVLATQAANPSTNVIYTIAPGEFSWDNWPSYTDIPGSPLATQIEGIQAAHPDYNPGSNPRWLMPKLANNFLRSDNPGILMTYAEVCFLRAEAAVLGWTTDNAKDCYENGIRAAMNILADYYGCSVITDAEYAAYIAEAAVAFGSVPDQQKSQINTQAWILHFHNPAEAWANVRRADYPKLQAPNTKNPLIDGADIPVRLCYPIKEETYSKDAYREAKDRVGNYSWHARLWWDTK